MTVDAYCLPETAEFGGESYGLRTDFRTVLKILQYLDSEEYPTGFRWQVALRVFYDRPVPPQWQQAAVEFLCRFLCGGSEPEKAGPKRRDWTLDAPAIIAGVNQAAGMEVRSLEKLHWWTFLSFFHSMGPGQLSLLVGIREKLRRGEALSPAEQEFYRCNRSWVRMEKPDPEREKVEKWLAQQAVP